MDNVRRYASYSKANETIYHALVGINNNEDLRLTGDHLSVNGKFSYFVMGGYIQRNCFLPLGRKEEFASQFWRLFLASIINVA